MISVLEVCYHINSYPTGAGKTSLSHRGYLTFKSRGNADPVIITSLLDLAISFCPFVWMKNSPLLSETFRSNLLHRCTGLTVICRNLPDRSAPISVKKASNSMILCILYIY